MKEFEKHAIEIGEWLIENAIEMGVVALIISIAFTACYMLRPSEVITELASGKLLNIEIQTGWNTNAILRFDDGSIIKIPYYIVRRRSMKEGRRYTVRRSSRTGIKIIPKQTGESKNEKL